MLGQVQHLEEFQRSVLIDRFNSTGHNSVLLFPSHAYAIVRLPSSQVGRHHVSRPGLDSPPYTSERVADVGTLAAEPEVMQVVNVNSTLASWMRWRNWG